MRINALHVFSFLLAVLLASSNASSHEKTWPEKRLKKLWSEAQSFTSKQISLTSVQIAELKNDNIQIGSEDRSPVFYFAKASDQNKTIGVILFIDATGENGKIELSVGMGTDGQVKKIDLWEHSENQLVAKDAFLKQFSGKTSKDSFTADKDYKLVSGSEKASEAVAHAIRKALKITNIVFDKK